MPISRRRFLGMAGSRQAQFLADVEHAVRLLVSDTANSHLSRMVPDLIRRIADG